MKSTSVLLTTSSLLIADCLMHGAMVLAQAIESVAPTPATSHPEQKAESEITRDSLASPQPIAIPETSTPESHPSTALKPYAVDASSTSLPVEAPIVTPKITPLAIATPDASATPMEFSGVVPRTVPLPQVASDLATEPTSSPISPQRVETTLPLSPEVTPTPSSPDGLVVPSGEESTQADPEVLDPTNVPSQAAPSEAIESPVLGVKTVPNAVVNPLLTTMPLNGQSINHQTAWAIRSDYNLGSGSNNYLSFSGLYRWGSQVKQGLSSDNVFSSEFSGTYSQFQTLRTQRVVEVNRNDPYTMLGLAIQMTLTGACVDAGNSAHASSGDAVQCTLLPPLVTDRESINEQLIPTRIDQPGKLGDPVSAETLRILAQPGFQNIGANGKAVGLDLYFPNIGTIPGNDSGTTSVYSQTEQVSTTSLTGYNRVSQILRANDKEAVMGITVRGAGIIWNQAGAVVNSLLGVATEALPTIVPHLTGGSSPANTQVNLNLFRAARDFRLPDDSWTLYQAGQVRAAHNYTDTENNAVSPAAQSFGVWVGLSPVTKRELTTSVRYQTTGPEEILAAAGAEGGEADNLRLVTNTNGAVLDTASMRNFYTQIYLTFLQRNVDLVVSDRLTETTTYHPHISLSGTVTDAHQSFRYYGGVITADTLKPYIGADYSFKGNNWGFSVGGMGYGNPDRDYFSHVRFGANYTIPTGHSSGLVLATGIRYAFNQTSNPLEQPIDNVVNAGVRFRWGGLSLGLTQYFGDVLPQSIGNATGIDALMTVGALSLQGFYTPSNSQASYGVLANYRLGGPENNLGLAIGWRRDTLNFGTTPSNNELTSSNDVFTLQLRLGSQS